MESFEVNWSKEELHTYLFIYCINADFKETKEELEAISLRTNQETYKKMHKEFEKDNDYASIQKINKSLKKLNYGKEEVNKLFEEIKELFLSDGSYAILEKNLLRGLQRLLK
ncbi:MULTISPECIES: hypothetical protein [Tenacibaculum]|uniref:Uncharacterized protein n=2 Tax=Tenacibaculum TaxID=104267 RepID=A0A420DYG3_9FLAO|nr:MULTISPECIES: hypothetical protein [Tenacibaculum]PHO01140.1 hypothetical protein CSC82_25160 [Rhodobacteraceae bacterium 4F10]MDP2541258.1 hypothetical protein [Tenacibaculum discolor]NVK09943.1 hypothetical protein [Tenacibaculum sp.]PHN98955.1 hypothetical protein CSC81_01890 [Tenacibaculum discolor]RKF02874.1 hypothetical protein C8N26_2516 [Tenacibaculum lutimaris]